MRIFNRNQKPNKAEFEKAIKGYELLIENINNSNMTDEVKQTLTHILGGYINLIKSGKL